MKSLELPGNGEVACIDAPDPEPGTGEVLVDTRVSALCGSELKAYRGEGMERGNSGHEAAGIVSKMGPGVSAPRVGQRVGVSAVSGCGDCPFCARGQYTWCEDRTYHGSTHAERFVTAARACHVLPDDVPWDAGVLLTGDGFGVPYHTSTKLRNEPVDWVAVFGTGPIGLGNTLMQTWLGRQVIAVDVSRERLDLAEKLGAAHAIDAGVAGDVPEAVRRLTGDRGADVCIEAAGRPETARQCFRAVRTAGTVVFNGEQPEVELSPSADFIRRDITAVGSWYYHFSEFPEMLALYRAGLDVERLITHRFPLEEADEGFRLMAAGLTGKVLLQVGEGA